MDQELKRKIRFWPSKPGVYLMKDKAGRVLYVGKALCLKDRIKSYFQAPSTPKVTTILRHLADIDYIVTGSELEALILESNLIKKWRPRYNIILRDDKQYPYLKLTLAEEFPRLLVVRRILSDGAKYFGPFKGGMVRETIRLTKRLFPIRWCKETPMKKREQPCLELHIKHCVGPCIDAVDKATYDRLVRELIPFLEGRLEEAITKLHEDMEEASKREEYERAATLRDRIQILEKMAEGQKVVSVSLQDRDLAAIATSGSRACLTIFRVRKGKLIDRENYHLEGLKEETVEEVMGTTLSQYYRDAAYIPPEIVLDRKIENLKLLEGWLKSTRRKDLRILVPVRGRRKELVNLALENARSQLEHKILMKAEEADVLVKLKEVLRLKRLPLRIEAFDISNILGTDIVGAMVVFQEGKPLKAEYRRFMIKTIQTPNDVAAIYEIIKRRYTGDLSKELGLPDLVLIDGGAGQVRSAYKALGLKGLNIPLIALAKKMENIYFPKRRIPLKLSRRCQGLRLLQRIRDEAHRFALAYHRLKRRKRLFA